MKFKGVKKATVIRTKTTEVFEQMTFSSTVVICTFCELIVYMTHTDVLLAYHVPRWGGGGGGWVIQISSDRDDRMGAKIKTPKNPWAKN